MSKKNVCIIGTGYVGGVTGACLADKGHKVICVDVDEKKMAQWRSDDLPISEPGLKDIIGRTLGKTLFFTTDIKKGIEESDIIFECVNTPQKLSGIGAGSFDMKYVDGVARAIAKHATADKIIVQKSTVPVQTAHRLQEVIHANNPLLQCSIASNPEFLAEGTAVKDFNNPFRVIIGVDPEDKNVRKELRELYFFVDDQKIMFTSIESAETIKLVSNAMLATRISVMNAIAPLCERTGADINEISKGVGLDPRIGSQFLRAGIGFGGSCFKKDLLALSYLLSSNHLEPQANLFKTVIDINLFQRGEFVRQMHERLFSLNEKIIAVFGFSFKSGTDDTRDAPAIDVCKDLVQEGATVRIVDALAKHKAPEIIGNVELCDSPYDAVRGADAIAVMTEDKEFQSLDLAKVFSLMKKPAWIFDGRNIYDSQTAFTIGFNYVGVGMPPKIHSIKKV